MAGATGLIGRALAARLRSCGREVIGTCRAPIASEDLQLDLAGPRSAWPAWPAADVTYICTGAGGLDACERDPDATRRVHVEGLSHLAEHAAASGSRVVLISTSHVFDGSRAVARAQDPRTPLTVYGRQKAEAEVAVLERPGGTVLRLSKVIGPGDGRLLAWKRSLVAGDGVDAFEDIAVAPLSLTDAISALVDVGDAGRPGVFQVSGPSAETYFSLARAVAEHVGARASLVRPASAEAAGIPEAFRPRHVLLEQTLPRPIAAAALEAVVASALG